MPIAAGMLAEGKTWNTFGPFRLGVWSKPFAVISIIGALILCYAGTQPPFNPIILPLFPDLPVPLNWLTNPLVFIAVALIIGVDPSAVSADGFGGPRDGAMSFPLTNG